MIETLLHNSAVIISITYLSTKLKVWMYKKNNKDWMFTYFNSLLGGLFSVVVMLNPIKYMGMIFDLRDVPVYFISYVLGWRGGLAVIIFPSIYRIYEGGSDGIVLLGILVAIILPAVIGSILHKSNDLTPPFSVYNMKRMLLGYIIYSFIHKFIMYILIKDIYVWILTSILMVSFSIISLITIANIVISENTKRLLQLKTIENNKKVLDLNKKLITSNNTLETLIDIMPVGVMIIDSEGEAKYLNDEGKKIIGDGIWKSLFEPPPQCSLHYLDDKKLKPDEFPLVRSLKKGESIKDTELIIRLEDKNDVFLLVSCTPIKNTKDKVTSVISAFKDITYLKNTEEKLRDSKEINKAMLNSITEGLSLTDINGNILSINKAGEDRLFNGKLPYGLIGTNIYDLLPEKIVKERRGTIKNIIKTKLPMDFESSMNGKKLRNIIYPVFNKNEEVKGIVTFSQDITKFKKYDEMQKNFINEIVKEREKLQSKNEELEIANNIKDDFIANVSHELKSPLNIIMTHLEYFLDENMHSLDEEFIDILNIAYKNSDRLKDMISNMLDISSIESHKLEFDYNSLNIVEFISNIVEDRKVVVKNKDIDIKFQCEYKNINIFTDKLRLRQVIDNILDNAIKFTIVGDIFLSIGVYKKHIEISIKDSGIGIDEDKLSRIFDPFYQVDSSTKKKFSGVGLGLSISKRIIEKMGGDIFVKNNIDKGCTFTIKIPFE